MGFIEVINTCDNFPQHDSDDKGPWKKAMSQLWKFCLPGSTRTFGYLIPATVSRMPWTSEFHLDESTQTIRLALEDAHDIPASGVSAMSKILKAAQDSGLFVKLFKWPGEKFPVLGAPFPFAVDRAIAPYFGIVSTGVQLTAFVRGENKTPTGIWIARRGLDKPMYAGMLDNAVGGAVQHDETPFESISREAKEELGIDLNGAISGGTVSWFNIKEAKGGFDPGLVEPGIQYVYDLEVDSKTVLYPAEDGIDWLRLFTIDEVKTALCHFEFKPSSAYVMIDFLVRHGIINAENDVEFPEIVSRLHRRLPSPVCSK